MLDYQSLKQNERKFVALTGLAPAEFRRLLPAFTRAYARAFPSDRTHAGKPRQRRLGAGRKAVLLRPEDKLLFILVYQKAYPLQELLGSLFGLSQSQANRWVHRLLPILVGALDRLGFLPERDPTRFSARERRRELLQRTAEGEIPGLRALTKEWAKSDDPKIVFDWVRKHADAADRPALLSSLAAGWVGSSHTARGSI